MLKMRLSTTSNHFELDFQHDPVDGITTCAIREVTPAGRIVDTYRGTAYCHKTDQFCKAIGRKISFTRALQRNFSRRERGELWEQFLQMVKV